MLQNQRLLVDRCVAAASVSNCLITCCGEAIGSRTFVARSGLGINASGQLVWAAGEQLSPAQLADQLLTPTTVTSSRSGEVRDGRLKCRLTRHAD